MMRPIAALVSVCLMTLCLILSGCGHDDAGPTASAPSSSAFLAAPDGVSANGGANQVSLTWNPVSGATSYNVYWSTTTSGATTAAGTRIENVTNPYIHMGLAASTRYFYVVTAVNGSGESAASTQTSAMTTATPLAIPAAPTVVGAVGGNNQVTLSWNTVSGATSYNVYWLNTAGVTTGTGTPVTSAASPYLHTALTATTTYYYIVTAVNSAGESAPSSEVSATTNPTILTAPAAPTGVVASGGFNRATISWPAVSLATSYNIYWSTTPGVTTATTTNFTNVASPYVQTGLPAATRYYYIVTAVNSIGESLPSSEVSTLTSAVDGTALYATNCAGCHGQLAASNVRRETAGSILEEIQNIPLMNYLSTLTSTQIQAIATVLNF